MTSDWGIYGGWGMGFGMVLMLLFWVLIILGIAALIRWLMMQPSTGKNTHDKTPLEIVQERYARDVSIATVTPHGFNISNILSARIAEIQDEGPDKVSVRMKVGDEHTLLSRITRRSRDQLGLAVGMEVFAQVKSVVLIA